ncbi:MAG: penicillin acylase family protein, partial [Bryobacteraceae bacterium]
IGFEWSAPFRYQRIANVLSNGRKFGVEDFQRLQQDVVSIPARRFQAVLRRWKHPPAEADKLIRRVLDWDASLTADSVPAAIYEVWMAKLPRALFGKELSERVDFSMVLRTLELRPAPDVLERALKDAVAELTARLGADRSNWRWGRLHQIRFRHPLNLQMFDRGPLERPGDGYTVNAAGGADFRQVTGASYRQIIDLSNWDRSVMTNAPGEVGDPESPHYSDLMKDWDAGRYHAMPFSRKAVEAATIERITLTPGE